MKKVKHFWVKMSFWLKLKSIIALFGAGGEFTMILTDQDTSWHYITVGATLVCLLITHLIEDKDNDGVVDLWEDKNNTN